MRPSGGIPSLRHLPNPPGQSQEWLARDPLVPYPAHCAVLLNPPLKQVGSRSGAWYSDSESPSLPAPQDGTNGMDAETGFSSLRNSVGLPRGNRLSHRRHARRRRPGTTKLSLAPPHPKLQDRLTCRWVPRPFQGWGMDTVAPTARSLPVVFTNKFSPPPLEASGTRARMVYARPDRLRELRSEKTSCHVCIWKPASSAHA